MKKSYLLSALLVVLAIVSCSKESKLDNRQDISDSKGQMVVCDFSFTGVSSFENNNTKAVKQEWAAGDVVFVFVNGITEGYLRLTNTEGNANSWNTECEGGIAEKLKEGKITVNAIYVPFADDKVTVAYNNGKWAISTGDVYFTTATAEASVRIDKTTSQKTIVARIDLAMYPGYVQIYMEKDSRIEPTFGEHAQYHCNMLNRFTSVELLSDGSFVPVAAEDNEHFNVRNFPGEENGQVMYGIIKSQDVPETTVFRIDGGFKDGKPVYSPFIFTYSCKKIEGGKAYALRYPTDAKTLKYFKWVRTLWGTYNISADKTIQFTPGNLQVSNVSQPHWQFAQAQKTFMADNNATMHPYFEYSSSYYDLFAWGASGVCSTNSTIKYLDKSNVASQVIALTPSAHYLDTQGMGYRVDLMASAKDCAFNYTTGGTQYDNVKKFTAPSDGDDWGSNSVEFTVPNTFRTLTASEWSYLAAHYTAKRVTVDGTVGWAIVLDGGLNDSYTAEGWKTAELNQGAVFFPRAGRKYLSTEQAGDLAYQNKDKLNNPSIGENNDEHCWKYWTASTTDEIASTQGILPSAVYFRTQGATGLECHANFAFYGFAVRLVMDVTNPY